MAFTLAFSVTESGDNKTITVTDTTGVYHVTTNPTGWGTPNPETTVIDSSTNTLSLDIVYTASDGAVTSYDTIDLHTAFLTGGHTDVTYLVYPLNCSHLKVSTVAIGTSQDVIPDGLYEITYTWKKGLGGTETHTDAIVLIDGVVKSALYELLRTIPTLYECDYNHERTVMDIIFIKGYYDSMIATAIVGREAQVINQLYVLERLVLNGSKYSW